MLRQLGPARESAVAGDIQLRLRKLRLRIASLQIGEKSFGLTAEVFEIRTVWELCGHERLHAVLDPRAACRKGARGFAEHEQTDEGVLNSSRGSGGALRNAAGILHHLEQPGCTYPPPMPT